MNKVHNQLLFYTSNKMYLMNNLPVLKLNKLLVERGFICIKNQPSMRYKTFNINKYMHSNIKICNKKNMLS
jgi:hypothetical protein